MARRLKDVSRRLLRRVRRDAAVASALAEAWQVVAPAAYAAATRPLEGRRRVVTVAVQSAPALAELASFHRTQLLDALNTELARRGMPPARQLRFVLEEPVG